MTDEAAQDQASGDDPLGLFGEQSKRLTLRQRLFAQAYVDNGGNATQAAIAAGYPEGAAAERGYENVRKRQSVIDEIERRWRLKTDAEGCTPDWIMGRLMRNLSAAEEAEKLSDANKALELLGKRHGMWTDRLESDGAMSHSIRVEFDEPDDA